MSGPTENKAKCPFNFEKNKGVFPPVIEKVKNFIQMLLSSDILDFSSEIDKRTEYLESVVDELYLNLDSYLDLSGIEGISLSNLDDHLNNKSFFLNEMQKAVYVSIIDIYINYLTYINNYSSEEDSKKCLLTHIAKGEKSMMYYLDNKSYSNNANTFFEKTNDEKENFIPELINFFKNNKLPDKTCHFAKSRRKKEYIDEIWNFIDKKLHPILIEKFGKNLEKYIKEKDLEALFILGELENN